MASTRFAPRQLLTYAAVGAVIFLADPVLPTYIAGCTLATVGILIRVWGCGHLRKNKELVTSGPYAHVKHPLYLGTFLIALGGILAAGSPEMPGLLIWLIAMPAFLISFFVYYLPKKKRIEGDRLERNFGVEAVAEFGRAVPDFVPSIRPYRAGAKKSWSFANVRKNHELEMDLVIVGVFCAMLLWGGVPGEF